MRGRVLVGAGPAHGGARETAADLQPAQDAGETAIARGPLLIIGTERVDRVASRQVESLALGVGAGAGDLDLRVIC